MSNSNILEDGEYYVFSKQEGEETCIGYIYTTRYGYPCEMHMRFYSIEIGKPLPLVITGNIHNDKGQIKTFNFDSRSLTVIDDVYNCALNWLHQMQSELKYPQIDESTSCTIAVIQVDKGVLSAFYDKDEFLNAFFETFDIFRDYKLTNSVSCAENIYEP